MDTLLDKETKDTLANRVYFIIQEAQREAVEKTKRACWEYIDKNLCLFDSPDVASMEKRYFFEELTSEKVLGEGWMSFRRMEVTHEMFRL